ncbi:MAG: 3-hydroxyacyl-CoA dehydrogenase NAD-binding domain-containing protein [Ginsengibacter sp.]
MIQTICVCGAGTMGSSIAQVCAQNGFTTILFDVSEIVLEKAKGSIQKNLQQLVDKQKISSDDKENISRRIKFINTINECKADLIIEAIVENIEAKIDLFNQLAHVNNAAVIFATNTSSIPVSQIQKNILYPERIIGMHFFNPATLMKLVEVVKGELTNDEVAQTIYKLCIQMNKTPVICKDAPGFIVNRIARHYYLEGMKIAQDGIASFENVDAVMEATGFKMGPFKLMDLIGLDINLSVSQSIYDALGKPERLKPSPIQIEKVRNGELGRKTGKGFYPYLLKESS